MSTRKHPRRRRGRKKKRVVGTETTPLLALPSLDLAPLPVLPVTTPALSLVRSRLASLNSRRALHG